MTDTEWRDPKAGRVNRLAAMGSTAVCCFTRAEIERSSRCYRIPMEKFRFVPLAFQKRDLFEPSDEGYVFSGGAQGRDWRTLLAAVSGLPYAVRVYTKSQMPAVTSNVKVEGVTREEFWRRMAAASCVVVPVFREPIRVTGDTTWTAAMAMGKVVIATEPCGAPDYMEHGVSGFYVDYGDAEALRYYIELVMKDSELRKRMGAAARERAWRDFSPEVFRRRVLSVLEEAAALRTHRI